jgi:hypothetical protein
MTENTSRNLESDLVALANHLRDDEEFAVELYCALCNSDWRHEDGSEWHGSWRYSAGLVADLRELGECYLDFYCSGIGREQGGEGTISGRVAAAMAELGWYGTGHGTQLWMFNPTTGERKLWVDGEWADPDDGP